MRRFPSALAISALTALAVTATAQADTVTDQIDAGRRAYESGDSQVAIQALQFAISEIESQLQQQRLALLPEPLPGWSADEAVSDSGGIAAMITGNSLSRTYRKDDGDATVQINVTADSPLLSMVGMMMSSPMFAQAGTGSKPYTYGGFRGMIEQGDGGDVKITLMVGTRILVQLDGSGGADRATLERYLEAMKLPELEKALLG